MGRKNLGWSDKASRRLKNRQLAAMDFTPEDIEAVQSCLEGIDRNVPVAVEPAAAKLLMPKYSAHRRRHPQPADDRARFSPV
jgi:hypothetical protein